MKTINNLVELAQAIEDGKNVEVRLAGDYRRLSLDDSWTLNEMKKLCNQDRFRIKPEAKIIPMEILINSGIDCEFCDKIDFANVGTAFFFNQIGNNYVTHQGHHYRYCRPRMNHWISLRNVPEDAQHYIAEWLFKYFVCESCASAGFKITGVKEGYRFAWESDK